MTWTRGKWTHKLAGRVLLSNYNDLFDSVNIVTGDQYTRVNINADGSTTGLPATPDATYNGLVSGFDCARRGLWKCVWGFTVLAGVGAEIFGALHTKRLARE
ncbi:MAG: hypothetical protein U0Y68_19510 [Blastocatellia bacterium]